MPKITPQSAPKYKTTAKQPQEQAWTRKQVAKYLGVSVSKVRTLEGLALHPKKQKGVNYFTPRSVRSYAATQPANNQSRGLAGSDGKIAALAFRLFSQDKNLREVVTELEIPPKHACELYEQWQTPDFTQAIRELKLRAAEAAEVEAQAKHEVKMIALNDQALAERKQSEREFDAFQKRQAARFERERVASATEPSWRK